MDIGGSHGTRLRGAASTATPSAAAAITRRARRRNTATRRPGRALVWFLITFLAIEYLRPPALQVLHFQMLFLVVIPVLWLLSRNRSWSPTLTLQACFVVTGALALPFASNNYAVYLQSRVSFGHFVTSLAVVWLLVCRRDFKLVVWSWIAILCLQAIYAIAHQGKGYGAFFGDENDLALALDMAFPFALVGFQLLSGWRRWLAAFTGVLLSVGVVVSWSRGGFLGFVAAAGYCILTGRNRVRNLLLGAAAAIVLAVSLPSAYKAEMETIEQTTSGTAETRLFIWVTALRMWKDYPIFGIGPGNAQYQLGRYQPEGNETGLFSAPEFRLRDWSGTALHSVYIELLAERGLLGIGLFTLLAIGHYRRLRRLRRSVRFLPPALARDAELYSVALEASVAGFLVAGAFLAVLYYPYFWFFTALAVALERAIRRDARTLSTTRKPSGAGVRIASRPSSVPAPG